MNDPKQIPPPDTPPDTQPGNGAIRTPDTPPPGDADQQSTGGEKAEGAEPGPEPQTEADVELQTQVIDPADIKERETPDAISHTVPLDVATLDDFADHVGDDFAPVVRRFLNQHPGVRPMITVAVHAQDAIGHAHDFDAEKKLALEAVNELTRLTTHVRNRFPNSAGGNIVDTVIHLLAQGHPQSAADAGLAAANAGR